MARSSSSGALALRARSRAAAPPARRSFMRPGPRSTICPPLRLPRRGVGLSFVQNEMRRMADAKQLLIPEKDWRILPATSRGDVMKTVFVVIAFLLSLPAYAQKIGSSDIGGVVTGPKGPEAGVWVIAETTGLTTILA